MATVSILFPLFLMFSELPPTEQSLRTFHIIEGEHTHSEALTACRTKYTDLVTVYTEEDNSALNKLADERGAWFGLQRGQFSDKWSNGDKVTFSNLSANCSSGPSCAAMTAGGFWESLLCTQEKHFMCYKQAGTELSYHLISDNLSWYDAQSYCRSNYADLVSIRDQNQNEAVKINGMNSNTPFWIGLLCDDWKWADGGRSAYRKWWSQSPSPSPNCVTMSEIFGGSWNSVPCSNTGPALCYSMPVHVSDESMSWEDALNYCKQGNRMSLLRVKSDQDQRELEYELRRRRVSGTLWLGLGQSQLFGFWFWSDWTGVNWNNWVGGEPPQLPLSHHCGAIDTGSFQWLDIDCRSQLRVLCEVK